MILEAFALLPRMSLRFQLSRTPETLSYSRRIESDRKFIETQTKIEDELLKNQRKLDEYMATWLPLASLWELNRDVFMENYKKIGEISAADFDLNVREFGEVSTQLALKEMVKVINFFVVNAKVLRRLILIEIEEWQQSYLQLLREITSDKIRSFFDYTTENGAKVCEAPQNVDDLRRCTAFYEQLIGEVAHWETVLGELAAEFEVLQKYEVPIDGPLLAMKLKCTDQWNQYRKKLEEADEVLDNARDSFKLLL